jgi:hypothetical protein
MTPDEMRALRRKVMDAKGRKRRLLTQMRGEPTSLVDATPIRTNLKRLHRLGFSLEALAIMNGSGTGAALRLIECGTSRTAERKFLPLASMPYSAHVPEVLPDTVLVPVIGAARRVRALMALGWRHVDITEMIGRSSHHIAAARHSSMLAGDWRLVAAAYDRMSTAVGPSDNSRQRASKAGYFPPFAWDDIDDPTERPTTDGTRKHKGDIDQAVVRRVINGDRLPMTPAERVAVVNQMRAAGWSLVRIEQHTGITKPERLTTEDVA